MDKLSSIINQTAKPVQTVLQHPDVRSILFVIAIGFGSQFFPDLPKKLTSHYASRAALVFLLINHSSKDVLKALIGSLLALVLCVVLDCSKEGFEILENQTHIIPECVGIKKKDLLEIFEGDEKKLIKTIRKSGVPYNVKFTDKDAPLIATYLATHGYIITDECKLPPKQKSTVMVGEEGEE